MVPFQKEIPRHAKLCPVIAQYRPTLAQKSVDFINANAVSSGQAGPLTTGLLRAKRGATKAKL
jgi:hypothetical protein